MCVVSSVLSHSGLPPVAQCCVLKSVFITLLGGIMNLQPLAFHPDTDRVHRDLGLSDSCCWRELSFVWLLILKRLCDTFEL